MLCPRRRYEEDTSENEVVAEEEEEGEEDVFTEKPSPDSDGYPAVKVGGTVKRKQPGRLGAKSWPVSEWPPEVACLGVAPPGPRAVLVTGNQERLA